MLSKSTLSILALALVLTVTNSAPLPGALQSTVSVQSVNHILSTFVPILSYYMLNNKTMELNLEDSGFGYKVEIDDIHIVSVDGWTTKDVEFLPNSNTVRLLFSGINIQSYIDG